MLFFLHIVKEHALFDQYHMVTGLKPPPRIGMQQSNAIYQQMGNES